MNIIKIIFTAVFLVWAVPAHAQETAKVIVKGAWVRALPPSVKTTAAYMIIENRTAKDMVLTSVSTPLAQAVEIHHMQQVDSTHMGRPMSMMEMQPVGNLTIPPMGHVTLAPGGYHMMVIGLTKPLQSGEQVPMILHFQDGTQVSVQATVAGKEG